MKKEKIINNIRRNGLIKYDVSEDIFINHSYENKDESRILFNIGNELLNKDNCQLVQSSIRLKYLS